MVWEDDETLLVGSIASGLLKLTASLADGREQILGLAGEGDFVGRPFGTRSSYSVTALAPARLCVVGRSAFERFAAAFPEVEHALLLRALDELDRARRWMLLLGRKSAGERVASLLIEFADRSTGAKIAFPLTRQQMADLLGLTIETVSRELTKLRHAEAISLTDLRHFRIEDEPALRQRAAMRRGPARSTSRVPSGGATWRLSSRRVSGLPVPAGAWPRCSTFLLASPSERA